MSLNSIYALYYLIATAMLIFIGRSFSVEISDIVRGK